MKTDFYAQRDLEIDGQTITSGTKVATIEIIDGVTPDRVFGAIQSEAITSQPPAAEEAIEATLTDSPKPEPTQPAITPSTDLK